MMWFSHKFNGSGYKLGVCIQNGWIVWVNGPFPTGDFPDLDIFRLFLKEEQSINEYVEVNEGIQGGMKFRTHIDYNYRVEWKFMKGKIHARYETVNRNHKEFMILNDIFRNNRCYYLFAPSCKTSNVPSGILG